MTIEIHRPVWRRPVLVLTAILCLSAPPPHASGAAWIPVGGPEAERVNDLGVAAADPSVIYAGTCSGVFTSMTRGLTWTQTVLTEPISGVAVDTVDFETVYAVEDKLYDRNVWKSIDGGQNWNRLDLVIPWGAASLALDPLINPSTVYAAGVWRLLKSTDGGGTWVEGPQSERRTLPGRVIEIAVSPVDQDILYAFGLGTNGGLMRSTDGGFGWYLINEGLISDPLLLNSIQTVEVVVAPDDLGTVYTATGNVFGDARVFRSTDDGMSWQVILEASAGSMECCSVDTSLVAALAFDAVEPRILYTATPEGVSRTRDGGETWEPINTGLGGATVTSLAVDPSVAGRVYAGTDGAGVFVLHSICGDGVLDAGEDCDDGNALGGDCCSASCEFEPPGGACGDNGNVCTDDQCDGAGTCDHRENQGVCDDGDPCTVADACTGGACIGVVAGPLEILCEEVGLLSNPCGEEVLPKKLRKTISRHVKRGRRLLEKAARRARKGKNHRALRAMARMERQMDAIERRASDCSAKGRISESCGNTIGALVTSRKQLAQAVAF